MLQPARLGYMAWDVADLEASTRFYSEMAQLEVVKERNGQVFLRGGNDHHWVVLRQSRNPRFNRVAYQMGSEEELDEMEQKLRAAGFEITRGGDFEEDGLERYIRFQDPEGLMIELYVNMLSLPVPPVARHYVNLETMLHMGFVVRDIRRAHSFYHDILGFRDSDWIEREAVFMHCGNRYHHSMVLFAGNQASVPTPHHLCIQVASLADVMRGRNWLVKNKIPLWRDLGKHMASGSVGIYFKDEANKFNVEFCIEHRQVDVPGHKARIIPRVAEGGDVWMAFAPISLNKPDAVIPLDPTTKTMGEAVAAASK